MSVRSQGGVEEMDDDQSLGKFADLFELERGPDTDDRARALQDAIPTGVLPLAATAGSVGSAL